MAVIGEMKKLTIGNKTYTLPSGGGGGGSGTVTSVGVSNATNGGLSVSGSPVTTSGTITVGHSNVLSSAQTTQAVYPIKIDKNGHVSEYGTAVTSMPASDVSAWAKASTKPTYTASEVGALPASTSIPTKTSDLTNDSGYITGYTETDPTVPSWAKQSTKPTYTASEVGALPSSTTIPDSTSDLTNDSGFTTLDLVYPVGSIYMSVNNTNPSTLFGGTWEQIEDTFLLSAGTSHSAGSTGGNESVSYTPNGTVGGHTLTIEEMPSHTHVQNQHRHATNGHVNYNSNYTADSAKGSGYRWGTSTVAYTQYTTPTNQNTGGGGSHSHGFTGTASTIETMPPYLVVYMWKRTA